MDDISNNDSMLALWITGPYENKIEELMSSWGFKFKGKLFTWIKLNNRYEERARELFEENSSVMNILNAITKIGMGYLTRKNSECLYYGTKGKGLGIYDHIKRNISEIVYHPVLSHSEKPEIFAELIERMYPNCTKIELFARRKRKGWSHFGNDPEVKNSSFKLEHNLKILEEYF